MQVKLILALTALAVAILLYFMPLTALNTVWWVLTKAVSWTFWFVTWILGDIIKLVVIAVVIYFGYHWLKDGWGSATGQTAGMLWRRAGTGLGWALQTLSALTGGRVSITPMLPDRVKAWLNATASTSGPCPVCASRKNAPMAPGATPVHGIRMLSPLALIEGVMVLGNATIAFIIVGAIARLFGA